ncbi:FRIGIDA-like protein 3 [Dorcoceras hygrometricum]|uniref:FRIGIDA-like protein 3 n=1 Tax=Dorcoceras hygrometricum TaxID=472368 RepID=A0A2Z7DEY4_9LAMI|nr:FRIGIDA-like protein 3 [Dorcoceras hygrometricum]
MSNVEQEADNSKRNSEESDVMLKNQQMVRVQQMATVEWIQQKRKVKISSSWCLKLAIAKRCRLHKLIRQRFAFAPKIQQMLFALITSSRKIPAGSYSTSRRELQRYIQPVVGKSSRKLFTTNDWTTSCKNTQMQSTLKMERING